jgi:HEAT repeat protein
MQPSNTATPWDETTRLVPVNIVETLIEELTSADGSIRRKAMWELGQRGNSDAIQPLVNSMMDADSKERSLILAALAEISSRSLKPLNQALALALQDPSPEVRKNAIRDLTRIYDNAAQLSRFLAHATQDNNPEVRETAHWALSQLDQIQPSPSLPSYPFKELSNPPRDSLPDSNSQ